MAMQMKLERLGAVCVVETLMTRVLVVEVIAQLGFVAFDTFELAFDTMKSQTANEQRT